jgi:hypothetical protein
MLPMDRLGREATRLHQGRMEQVVYHARTTAQATPVDYPVEARFRDYRLSALTTEAIQLTDQECLIRTALVTWTPTTHDDITRADGTLWRVMSVPPSGRARPHYLLQCRQIG